MDECFEQMLTNLKLVCVSSIFYSPFNAFSANKVTNILSNRILNVVLPTVSPEIFLETSHSTVSLHQSNFVQNFIAFIGRTILKSHFNLPQFDSDENSVQHDFAIASEMLQTLR